MAAKFAWGGSTGAGGHNKARTTVDALRLDPTNPRQRTARGRDLIVRSLKEHGAARSIVLDERDVVIAGNGVIDAATEAGISKVRIIEAGGDEIIAVRRRGLSAAQKHALALADNRTGELAEWNVEQLQADIRAGVDFAPYFFPQELTALVAGGMAPGRTHPDAVPERRPTDIVAGDVFELGHHRLLCGDSTDARNLDRVLEGVADLALTDPPYGIGEAYQTFHDSKANLAMLIAAFFPLVRERARVVMLTPGNDNQRFYPQPDWTLCWFVAAGIGRCRWGFSCWQPVLVYGKCPYLALGKGARPDGVARTEAADNDLAHPCPKPVGVWAWFLERGSVNDGETVLDPFLGSGTTLIAGEQLGRSVRGIEAEPQYVQVAIDRWEAFTGQKARKVGDARPARPRRRVRP